MSKKVRLCFVLPRKLLEEAEAEMAKDGYDLKGKSRWIAEAVVDLLNKDYLEMVKFSEELHAFDQKLSLTIPYEVKQLIDVALRNVRIQYPTMEGVQSNIIRTAIIQRLLNA